MYIHNYIYIYIYTYMFAASRAGLDAQRGIGGQARDVWQGADISGQGLSGRRLKTA